jgi:hypothetical protein
MGKMTCQKCGSMNIIPDMDTGNMLGLFILLRLAEIHYLPYLRMEGGGKDRRN